MTIPDPPPAKSQLRKLMRAKLRGCDLSSATACENLARWLAGHPSLRTIAAYSPLPGEVDLAAAIARRPDIAWVHPKISGERLTFHIAEIWTTGAFGISEPAGLSPEVPVAEIDAFLCPGLAFTPAGGRLGRGRGYYDRMLATARPDALKIGICHEFQIVPDTFSEPHDIPMDIVVW